MSTKKVEVDKSSFHNPYSCMSPISPEQCRAARAWLDWSQAELSKRASVGLSTVKDFERGERTPIANNRAAIQKVFEQEGIFPSFNSVGEPTGIEKRMPALAVD